MAVGGEAPRRKTSAEEERRVATTWKDPDCGNGQSRRRGDESRSRRAPAEEWTSKGRWRRKAPRGGDGGLRGRPAPPACHCKKKKVRRRETRGEPPRNWANSLWHSSIPEEEDTTRHGDFPASGQRGVGRRRERDGARGERASSHRSMATHARRRGTTPEKGAASIAAVSTDHSALGHSQRRPRGHPRRSSGHSPRRLLLFLQHASSVRVQVEGRQMRAVWSISRRWP